MGHFSTASPTLFAVWDPPAGSVSELHTTNENLVRIDTLAALRPIRLHVKEPYRALTWISRSKFLGFALSQPVLAQSVHLPNRPRTENTRDDLPLFDMSIWVHAQPTQRRQILRQHPKLSPQDQTNIARRYGLKAALFASAAGITGGIVPGLSNFLINEAKAQDKAKYKLRFGAGVMTPTNETVMRTGVYEFVKRVEEASGGEVAIQIIDKSQACAETTCGERVLNNVLHMGASSPQNLGAPMPYSIAMDWPFLWRDRTEYHNFMFSKESNRLYRDVMRKTYGVMPLYVSGEMRNVMMGMKYTGKPSIVSPGGLMGAKIRITNSEMISNFAQSMKMNPIPLAWTELLEGLKSGVVDAAETWPGAAVGFGMHSVLSQDVGVEFSPGCEVVIISASTFDAFPDKIKLIFLQAAHDTMRSAYDGVAEAQDKMVGNGKNPSADSAYAKSSIKHTRLTEAQRNEFKAIASVESNAQLYSGTRKKLDQIAGFDVYGAMKEAAAKVAGKPLQPARWWV